MAERVEPSISVVVDLLLMGFKAQPQNRALGNAGASETEGVSEKDRCRRNPFDLPLFFLLP